MRQRVEVVSSVALPVDETLEIKRCRYIGGDKAARLKRLSVVTGTHGDELEGQYVAFMVGERIKKHPELLNGIVDIYPAANPLGIDSIQRGIPGFDLDMNRVFPGDSHGTMVDIMAGDIIESLNGSDLVLDIHASNIFLREMPQARINENMGDALLPIAEKLNLDFLWVHPNATVLESTLCYSLNIKNIPCVVIEAGVGMRITKEYCVQLTDGIFNIMKDMGIWLGEDVFEGKRHCSITSEGREIAFLNASCSGVFIQSAEHASYLKKNDVIGRIVKPLTGEVIDEVLAPCDGLLFTVREYPVVYEGSLIARMLGGSKK
ncbi:MAG: M14 family metallopeptidase [Eubacterium sp.]|nr:M14 family metallopeptidase [Eubacterium sp.]